VQRGRDESYCPREQVGEEPAYVAQEGALGLHATELLEEREVKISESESLLREAYRGSLGMSR
jgi:hypothetical protein